MVGVLLARAGLTALPASVNPDLACPCFLLISSEAIGRSAYPGRGRSCWLPRYSSFKAITPCTSPQRQDTPELLKAEAVEMCVLH
jgi:hypothetical protein